MNSIILKQYHDKKKQNVSALISYALLDGDTEEIINEKGKKLDGLILDCGAWTDQRSPTPTDIDDYINYLIVAGEHYDFYFNLDQDFDENVFSGLNLRHLLKLEEAGLNPVPVIHSLYTGEIEYYIDKGYKIIALGSSYATRLDALKFVFDKFTKYPDVKIHIFGSTDYENLIEVPAYSVDSASWAISGKFGELTYWNPESDKVDKTERIYIGGYYRPYSEPKHHIETYYCKKQLDEYLDTTFHFTHKDFLGEHGYGNLQIANIQHYVELERRITEEHRKKGFNS
jgi:hypothetical protein